MEKKIEDLQAKNIALEARVVELEKSVDEMKEPVQKIDTLLSLASKSIFSIDRNASNSSSSSIVNNADPDIMVNIENWMKEASVTALSISQPQLDRLKNIDELIRSVRTVPYRSSKGFFGYRVSGIRKDSILYELGIKNGDVLVAVNEKPFYPLNSVLEIYEEIKISTGFTLLLRRRAKHHIFQYSLKK